MIISEKSGDSWIKERGTCEAEGVDIFKGVSKRELKLSKPVRIFSRWDLIEFFWDKKKITKLSLIYKGFWEIYFNSFNTKLVWHELNKILIRRFKIVWGINPTDFQSSLIILLKWCIFWFKYAVCIIIWISLLLPAPYSQFKESFRSVWQYFFKMETFGSFSFPFVSLKRW